MSKIDPIIHQPVRLRMMAALNAIKYDEQMDFVLLRNLLGATDGNLGAHLQKLEEAGYIEIEKKFIGRKPRTLVSASDKGRSAFRSHVQALKAIIE